MVKHHEVQDDWDETQCFKIQNMSWHYHVNNKQDEKWNTFIWQMYVLLVDILIL